MKHVVIEGWRGINHSAAMVNQYQLIEFLKMNGIKVYHHDLPFLNPNWNEVDNDSGFSLEVKKQIKNIPPPEWGWYDSLYCTESRLNKPRPLANKIITFIVTEYGLNIQAGKNSFIDDVCYGDDLIVVPSNWVFKKLLDFGFPFEKLKLVPHGVNPDIFYPLADADRQNIRQLLTISSEHFMFLNVGAMTWNKGIDILVRAFVIIRKQYKNARLVLKDNLKLYGFGIERILNEIATAYPNLIDEEIRSSIVLLTSTMTLQQLRWVYGSADAYVSPYRAEGFNLPVIEAIASGTPVIVTSGGATDDFCTENTARFVKSIQIENKVRQLPVGGIDGFHLEPDIDSLVEQMQAAITNKFPAPDLFKQGYNQLLENYSWEICTHKLASLF